MNQSRSALPHEIPSDHYIERPFMDPYECFDDSAPLESFPVPRQLRGAGALEGLFQCDPEPLAAKAAGASAPDIRIEYLPGGGYRMRSLPGKRGLDGAAESATDTGDPLGAWTPE